MRSRLLTCLFVCIPFAACDAETTEACEDCEVETLPQDLPVKAPPVELTGADARYVHATLGLEAPFAMRDWCVNVSLVSKGDIDATGLFCLSQFESGDNELLANLKCDPSHSQTLVVTIEDVEYDGGDWGDECGALGCFAQIDCREPINVLDLVLEVAAR